MSAQLKHTRAYLDSALIAVGLVVDDHPADPGNHAYSRALEDRLRTTMRLDRHNRVRIGPRALIPVRPWGETQYRVLRGTGWILDRRCRRRNRGDEGIRTLLGGIADVFDEVRVEADGRMHARRLGSFQVGRFCVCAAESASGLPALSAAAHVAGPGTRSRISEGPRRGHMVVDPPPRFRRHVRDAPDNLRDCLELH